MTAKHSAYRAISRLHAAVLGRRPAADGQRVLLYHAVGVPLPEDPCGTGIARGLFRAHVEWLDSVRGEWKPAPFGVPPESGRTLALSFDDGYKAVLTEAAPVLTVKGFPFTVFVSAANLDDSSGMYLTPADLRELAALPGVAIGAHGLTHVPLDRLDDAALRRELEVSRGRLEDVVGKQVNALSYPFGAVDRRVRDAAQAAGYLLGGCSRYGLNRLERDPLLLCRTEVTAWDTAPDLALKVFGHWDWFRFRHRDPAA
ncbi:MAG: polysaccharide deacetylase family protein [Elusimicrobiota bacterium]